MSFTERCVSAVVEAAPIAGVLPGEYMQRVS